MDIKVLKTGVHYRHGSDFVIDRPNGAGDYVFIHMHTPVRMEICGRESVEPANMCILLGPRTRYRYTTVGRLFDNTWLHASGRDMAVWAAELGIPMDRPLHPGRTEQIVPLVHEMGVELAGGALHAERIAALAVRKLFLLLARQLQSPAPAPTLTAGEAGHLDRLQQVRQEVQLSAEQPWTVTEMARRAHLSPSRFSTVYRRCFQISPMEDLIRARLDRAAWLLSNTPQPVCAVATACGFENIHYFSRLFRRRMGHPPSRHGRG